MAAGFVVVDQNVAGHREVELGNDLVVDHVRSQIGDHDPRAGLRLDLEELGFDLFHRTERRVGHDGTEVLHRRGWQ